LLVLLRRAIADPPAAAELVPPEQLSADQQPQKDHQLPVEAWPERQRRRHHNRRRQQDPLGEGHPGTWRTRLIKVAAQVVVRARRVRVFLSGCWPHLEHFRQVGQAVLAMPPPTAADTL